MKTPPQPPVDCTLSRPGDYGAPQACVRAHTAQWKCSIFPGGSGSVEVYLRRIDLEPNMEIQIRCCAGTPQPAAYLSGIYCALLGSLCVAAEDPALLPSPEDVEAALRWCEAQLELMATAERGSP